MNILHAVEFYDPSQGGAQEVVKQLSQRLVQKGHQVTVATSFLPQRKKRLIQGVKFKQFKVSGNQVRGMKGEIKAYQRYVIEGTFDLVLTYAAQQWTTDALLPVLAKIKAKKILAPCGFSGLYEPAYQPYFRELPHFLRQFDRLIFHTSTYRDIAFAKRHGIKHYSIIPNGAGADEFLVVKPGQFRKKHHLEHRFLVLTVGSHTGGKGHQECLAAFAKAKLKDAVLVIIGNQWKGGCTQSCQTLARRFNRWLWWQRNRVLLLDLPRRETVQAFRDADLFVLASNLECSPLVLFEAMASHTAFVTTPTGNAAEIIRWGRGGVLIQSKRTENGLVYAQIDDLAEKLRWLQQHTRFRTKLAASGFKSWKQRFTWEKIVNRYQKLYYDLVAPTIQS